MTDVVFLAVIGAALLHASWNALVKGGRDKTVNMGAVVLGHVPFAFIAALMVPIPNTVSYPYLVGGILLHLGYQVFLLESYKYGDLTKVYPLARGSAPLMVTVFSIAVLGVSFGGFEVIAVLIIAGGIVILSLAGRKRDIGQGKTVLLSLITGLFIASYSVVDGLGAKMAGTAVGYYAWLSMGNGLLMATYLWFKAPASLAGIATQGKTAFMLGGSASFVAYAIVTWAFTQAPIALVTALRETSIAFAVIIGVVILKERVTLIKVLSIAFILCGAALLKLIQS